MVFAVRSNLKINFLDEKRLEGYSGTRMHDLCNAGLFLYQLSV